MSDVERLTARVKFEQARAEAAETRLSEVEALCTDSVLTFKGVRMVVRDEVLAAARGEGDRG